jgi:hypothetical protein
MREKCAGTPLCCSHRSCRVEPASNISAYDAVLTDPWKNDRPINELQSHKLTSSVQVMFELHHEVRILLSPKHNTSVTGSAINCELTSEENLHVGYGILESIQ